MIGYVRNFDNAKTMPFLVKNEELLEKRNKTWDKVGNNIMKKGFGRELVFSNKYPKAKIKSYNNKVNTVLKETKSTKKGSLCSCLSIIIIDLEFKMGKSHYLQVYRSMQI